MPILAPFKRIYEHYCAYHTYGPPRLRYMGYVGAATILVFYFMRFTRPDALPFDDIVLRALALVFFAGLALEPVWPDRLRPYYMAFSYVAMVYCLPFFTVLTALQRGGGIPAISNAFIVICFLIFLTDWRNTLFMLAAGTAMAIGAYLATAVQPKVPMDLVAQLPAFLLILAGGTLFKYISAKPLDTGGYAYLSATGDAHRLAVLTRAQAVFRGKRLLVVDDDPTLRSTTRQKLQPLGAIIDEAPDGHRAMAMLEKDRYDLVILDLNMPVMDGYALAELVRQGGAPANRDVCIVAHTSELAHAASARAWNAGMNAFISKPCGQLPLVQALCEAMEHPLTRAGATSSAGHILAAGGANAAGAPALLDAERLEGFRHIGMLEELVNDYLPEISRLVERLEGNVDRRDMSDSLETLHSLLGMTGEAGASALYQLVRQAYVPMVEDHRWPTDAGWMAQLKSVSVATGQALRAYAAARPQTTPF